MGSKSSSRPAMKPGGKLRTRSTMPAPVERRTLSMSSWAENSRPSFNSIRIRPDLRPDLDEAAGCAQLQDSTFAERQPGEQVDRQNGEPEPGGDPSDYGKTENDGAELDQQDIDRGVHAALPYWLCSRLVQVRLRISQPALDRSPQPGLLCRSARNGGRRGLASPGK